jgi:Fe-S cluster assembly ATP-binding protein
MTATPLLAIDDLHVSVAASQTAVEILHGVSLTVEPGEIHVLMGPNGSGKSTLASALMGSPDVQVTGGRILLQGDDITYWDTDVRAKAGMFLAFQYPREIAGVSLLDLLGQSLSARKGTDVGVRDVRRSLMAWTERLDIDESFMERHVNDGFSGEEKKRSEILQMAVLEPSLSILDETDTGLDADGLRTVAKGLREIRKDRPAFGALVITHDERLLDHLEPDHFHVLLDGCIVESGGRVPARSIDNGDEGVR